MTARTYPAVVVENGEARLIGLALLENGRYELVRVIETEEPGQWHANGPAIIDGRPESFHIYSGQGRAATTRAGTVEAWEQTLRTVDGAVRGIGPIAVRRVE